MPLFTITHVHHHAPPSTAALAAPSPGDGSEVDHYRVFRSYIEHEDELIHQRTTWNITIQGFLFAAYALVLQSYAAFEASVAPRSAEGVVAVSNNVDAFTGPQLLLFAAVYAVPGVGILVGLLTTLSTWAAALAIKRLEKDFERVVLKIDHDITHEREAELRAARIPFLPNLTGGGHKRTHLMGFIFALAVPVLFVVAWAVISFLTWKIARAHWPVRAIY